MTSTIHTAATIDPSFDRSAPSGTTITTMDVATTRAPRVDVVAVNQYAGDHQTLHNINITARPGEILAIAGGSGSGKTTLLEAMVGVRPAETGCVLVDGEEFSPDGDGIVFGFVPQDDIIHTELPLRRILEHAAALRLPAGSNPDVVDAAVTRTLRQLDLTSRADVPVGSLSGGQRKRASIAVELLADPVLFFLDEPTSGLDPATSTELMRELRGLAETGTTIVLTTHSPVDLCKCDRVVFLGREGHLAFIGTPCEAAEYFDVDDLSDIYEILAATDDPAALTVGFNNSRWNASTVGPTTAWPRVEAPPARVHRVSRLRQWRALTRRNADLFVRNKLTLAILLGSPTMVVGMMAVLFRPGGFDVDQASAMPAIQTLFWVAFAAFFFGVTYGLLQIVGEFAIFRRERFAGVSTGSYVASKVTVLAPLVTVVNIAMLAVLRVLDRLPANSLANWMSLTITLVLVSMAALSMGLLASAAVSNPAQATLALPMLCFPQVLFAGAVVPTSEMAMIGRWMSFILADRWGFESLGRTFGLSPIAARNPATEGYVDVFVGSAAAGWGVLLVIIAASLLATTATLRRRS